MANHTGFHTLNIKTATSEGCLFILTQHSEQTYPWSIEKLWLRAHNLYNTLDILCLQYSTWLRWGQISVTMCSFCQILPFFAISCHIYWTGTIHPMTHVSPHCDLVSSAFKTPAPCEDWTHDLQIMRLTRCLLRQRGLEVLLLSLRQVVTVVVVKSRDFFQTSAYCVRKAVRGLVIYSKMSQSTHIDSSLPTFWQNNLNMSTLLFYTFLKLAVLIGFRLDCWRKW